MIKFPDKPTPWAITSITTQANSLRYVLAGNVREYCLIVEGAYLSESEAEHALRDPFIEDWVEQTGHFKIHNMNEIQVTAGVTLGSLGVVMLDDRLFEIASADADHPLTELKARGVAEALKRQDMFDEVEVKPRDEAAELIQDESAPDSEIQ